MKPARHDANPSSMSREVSSDIVSVVGLIEHSPPSPFLWFLRLALISDRLASVNGHLRLAYLLCILVCFITIMQSANRARYFERCPDTKRRQSNGPSLSPCTSNFELHFLPSRSKIICLYARADAVFRFIPSCRVSSRRFRATM